MKDKKGLFYLKEHKLSFALSFFFLIASIILLFSSLSSSNEIQDSLRYYNNDLSFDLVSTDKFYSHLEKDTTILKGTLTSHKSISEIKQVGLGYQLVMEYQLETSLDALRGILSDIYFYDGETNQLTEKDYYIAYKQELEGFREICTEYKNISLKDNQTQNCLTYENQSYTYYQWTPYNSKDIPKGVLTLGLFVYCEEGDYLDGVWSFSGKKITKHAYWEASLDNGLISYYKLDETSGTIAVDSTETANGTASNARIFTTEIEGKINTAGDFSEASDNIYIENEDFSTTFSISLWIYPFDWSTNSRRRLLTYGASDSDNNAVQIVGTDDSKVAVIIYGGAILTSNDTVSNNEWTHLVVTKTGTTTRIYLNGEISNYGSQTALLKSGKFRIGHPYFDIVYSNDYDGYADEIGIWNRVLTDDEVELLYSDRDPPCFECFDYEGTGTSEDPYQIINWTGLHYIRDEPSAYYKLMNNLTSSLDDYNTYASELANEGVGFIPINSFTGNFDGNNKAIKDLYIDYGANVSDNIGLFKTTNEAYIQNLIIDNAEVIANGGGDNAGVLIGYAVNTTLDEIYLYNSLITGLSNTGGLIGYYYGDFSNTAITGILVYNTQIEAFGSKIGGIFGYLRNSLTLSVHLESSNICIDYPEDCLQYVGGIAGMTTNNDLLSGIVNNSIIKGVEKVGGSFGLSEEDDLSYIYSFENNIQGTGDSIGGIIGHLDGSILTKSFSYLNNIESPDNFVGGLVGNAIDYWNGDNSEGYIEECFTASSNITGKDGVGGLVGRLQRDYRGEEGSKIFLLNSYSALSRISGEYSIGGAVGRLYGTSESENECLGVYNILTTNTFYNYIDDGGGLIGYAQYCDGSPFIFNSFWDYTLYASDSEYGTNATTEQLNDIDFYLSASWDIETTTSNLYSEFEMMITDEYYAFLGFIVGNSTFKWLIYEGEPSEPLILPELKSNIPNLYICPNETGIFNISNYWNYMENPDDFLWEIRYLTIEGYDYSYKANFPDNTFTIVDDENNSIISFTLMTNGYLVIETYERLFDNPSANEFRLTFTAFNSNGSSLEDEEFFITLNNDVCWTEITPPDDETPPTEDLEGWFGNIINWFLSFFPESEDLSFMQKSAIIVISMTLITLILLVVTWSSEAGIPTPIIYLTGFINFILLIFFIAIGYIPIFVIILLALIIIALAWFRVKGNTGGS